MPVFAHHSAHRAHHEDDRAWPEARRRFTFGRSIHLQEWAGWLFSSGMGIRMDGQRIERLGRSVKHEHVTLYEFAMGMRQYPGEQ